MSFERVDRMFRPKASTPEPEPECEKCFGAGWECYGLGHNDPHFRVCDACGNPEGYPSP